MADSSCSLNLVVLRCAEIERAVSFYRLLGLEFVQHAHGKGPQHYAAECGGMVFEIYPASAKSPATTGLRLGFRVAEVDEVCARLCEAGAEVVSAPADSPWGRRAVLRDFAGQVIELTDR